MVFCQHLTAELVRRPDWLLHPDGAERLAGIVVVVDDPVALEQPYERLLGAGNAIRTDRMLTVRAGDETILFVTPDDLDTLFPDLDHVDRKSTRLDSSH